MFCSLGTNLIPCNWIVKSIRYVTSQLMIYLSSIIHIVVHCINFHVSSLINVNCICCVHISLLTLKIQSLQVCRKYQMYVCTMCVCVCVYVYVYMCMSVRVYVCMCMCLCVCVCVYVYVCMCMCVCVCVYVYVCMCVCVCVYV